MLCWNTSKYDYIEAKRYHPQNVHPHSSYLILSHNQCHQTGVLLFMQVLYIVVILKLLITVHQLSLLLGLRNHPCDSLLPVRDAGIVHVEKRELPEE